jgi:F0F1-type ATP synthase epsilon subunit
MAVASAARKQVARILRTPTLLRSFSDAASNSELVLNLAVPHTTLVGNAAVKMVTVPGRDGVFAVEKSSPPIISELRPGLLRVDHLSGEVQEFFVPGGFIFNHAGNKCDVSVPEGVSLEDIDTERVRGEIASWNAKKAGAPAGSKNAAEADAALEVLTTLAKTLGVSA